MAGREKMTGLCATCHSVLGMPKRILTKCSGKRSGSDTLIYVILLVDVYWRPSRHPSRSPSRAGTAG